MITLDLEVICLHSATLTLRCHKVSTREIELFNDENIRRPS